MKLTFDGTPAELKETLHTLYPILVYTSGYEEPMLPRVGTEQELDDEILRPGWIDEGIKCVNFYMDHFTQKPYATVRR